MNGAVVLGAIAVGIGATLVMDLWNLLLKRGFGIASLVPGGTFNRTSPSKVGACNSVPRTACQGKIFSS